VNADTPAPWLHLQVAFGTVVQLMCEGDEAEARRVATFNKTVGLPVTLADLHVTLSEPKLDILVSKTLEAGSISWNLGPHLTPDLVRQAILGADKLGSSLKE
jgi:glycerol dehydrogenase